MPIFQIYHTNEFIGKIAREREHFLTSREVKKGRWVYDGGGQEHTRKLKTEGAITREQAFWWAAYLPLGAGEARTTPWGGTKRNMP